MAVIASLFGLLVVLATAILMSWLAGMPQTGKPAAG